VPIKDIYVRALCQDFRQRLTLYFPRKNGHVILGFLYCVIEGIG
jgi:hypothetical protein